MDETRVPEKRWAGLKMASGRLTLLAASVLFWAMVAYLLVGCGDTIMRPYDPITEVMGVDLYTEASQVEGCILEAVLASYEHRYGQDILDEVDSIWLVRDLHEDIPCLELTHGEACRWDEVYQAHLGVEDARGIGLGGLAKGGHIFLSTYGFHSPYFAKYFMHELNHAARGVYHKTIAARQDWCEWENTMWFDWSWPHIKARCPNLPRKVGTVWFLCPWTTEENAATKSYY